MTPAALLTERIARVEEMSRPPEVTFRGRWELCGLRLTAESSGRQVCVART